MVIDDQRKHILTNYYKVKSAGKATDSDHYTQYLDLELEFLKEKPIRQEIFNFMDEKAQNRFKTITSNTSDFTDCFKGETSLFKKVENGERFYDLIVTRLLK